MLGKKQLILALDQSGNLHIFASENDVYAELEAIDIENQEYEFCNMHGVRFVGQLISPITAFRAGSFRLVQMNASPISVREFIYRAKVIGRTVPGIQSLNDLVSYLFSEERTQ